MARKRWDYTGLVHRERNIAMCRDVEDHMGGFKEWSKVHQELCQYLGKKPTMRQIRFCVDGLSVMRGIPRRPAAHWVVGCVRVNNC